MKNDNIKIEQAAQADNKLLNYREVTALLRVSKRTVVTLVTRKQIPHLRIGKRVLFDPVTLRGWIAAQQIGGGGL